MDLGELVYEKQIEPKLNAYMGAIFEQIVIEYFEQRKKKRKVGLPRRDFQTFYCILKRINLYFIYADIVHR